jgi:hypothetical protein
MTRAITAAAVALVMAGHARTKQPSASRPSARPSGSAHPISHPAAPLPMLPSVARVRLEVARDRVILVEEVNLPRGDWTSGGLNLYVAFGAPGTPAAVDAHLVAPANGSVESLGNDAGESVGVEPAVRRLPSAQPLLGQSQMAGVVLHVRDSQLRKVYEATGLAVLRVRSLLSASAPDGSGARDVVVRLGIHGGLPLTLSKVQVVSLEPKPWVTRAEANLCGPDAETLPLAVGVLPHPARRPPPPASPPIAPSFAVRHPSDDLCVRWWAAD